MLPSPPKRHGKGVLAIDLWGRFSPLNEKTLMTQRLGNSQSVDAVKVSLCLKAGFAKMWATMACSLRSHTGWDQLPQWPRNVVFVAYGLR